MYTTVATMSAPQIRLDKPPPKKTAPLPASQLKEKHEKRETRQAEIDAAVDEWRALTNEKASELAERFDLKPRYFLDLFFQGGAKMVHHQEKINPYNVFKSEKAAEMRECKCIRLHTDHFEEYQSLTITEKDALVECFRNLKDRNFKLRRDTPRAKIQDVTNIVRNMKMLMAALGNRVGIEGFFCIVRNTAEFHMAPEWYFTSPELEAYMPIATRQKWDTGQVGMKIEAFAVAGCDPVNLLRTSKQKADWMKAEIRELINKGLGASAGPVDVSQDANTRMAYTWYEEDVVQHHGVLLEGWTGPPFGNPSEFSTSLMALGKLLDALKTGACAFRKLSPAEAAKRKEQWDADVAAGHATAKSRAKRSDAGIPHKWPRDDTDKENDSPSGTGDHDDGEDNTPDDPPPPKKRAHKANAAAPAKTAVAPAKTAAAPAKSRSAPQTRAKKAAATPRDNAATKAALECLKASRKRIVSRAVINDSDAEGKVVRRRRMRRPGRVRNPQCRRRRRSPPLESALRTRFTSPPSYLPARRPPQFP
ncbi:hypothetical protein B0H10DRAFT_1957892 [Mycena sp. CBHHK59/15]|nr:hypothetical protein B0H10DRAFT_1957892 [Mycena sp. CBHHK59/15]